jgi:hypothetical protein
MFCSSVAVFSPAALTVRESSSTARRWSVA